MEGEPEQMEMGMSQEDMAKGISEVRIALVGNAADVLYDISRNVEKDAINFAFKVIVTLIQYHGYHSNIVSWISGITPNTPYSEYTNTIECVS